MCKFWIIGIALVVLSGCRAQRVVTVKQTQTRDSTHNNIRTEVKNTIIRDSIYIRERGDTVYVDRWHTEIRDSIVNNTDTIKVAVADSIPYVVEVPVEVEVEKPIAPFYKWCTAILWMGVIVVIWLRSSGFHPVKATFTH